MRVVTVHALADLPAEQADAAEVEDASKALGFARAKTVSYVEMPRASPDQVINRHGSACLLRSAAFSGSGLPSPSNWEGPTHMVFVRVHAMKGRLSTAQKEELGAKLIQAVAEVEDLVNNQTHKETFWCSSTSLSPRTGMHRPIPLVPMPTSEFNST